MGDQEPTTTIHRYTVREIREKVSQDPAWATKAITAIYAFQTRDEQQIQETRYHNDVGFNGVDAHLLSSFAQQIARGRTLSPKQLAIAYRKLPKYAQQLWEISHPEKRSEKPGPRK